MRLPRGGVWLPPELQANLVGGLQRRTTETRSPREIEIIRHVALGLRNAEVARKLLITELTVKKHLNGDLYKVGVRDRVELALYAIKFGLISAHERVA